MSTPQLAPPPMPTPGLWAAMKRPWHQDWIAFYLGPAEAADPVTAHDLETLAAFAGVAEVALRQTGVWPPPVVPHQRTPDGGAGGRRLMPGELASRGGQGLRDEHRHALPVRDGARRRGPGRRPSQGAGGWLG